MGEICLRDTAESEVVGYLYGIFGLGWGFAVCLLCACGELCESLIDPLSPYISLSLFFFFLLLEDEECPRGFAKEGTRPEIFECFCQPLTPKFLERGAYPVS